MFQLQSADEKLAGKDADPGVVEKAIEKECVNHAKSYANEEKGFTCCMIEKAADGTSKFMVHQGSAMSWTGTAKSLVLPAKQSTEEGYDTHVLKYAAKYAEETAKRPPWNNGWGCTGPAVGTKNAAKLKDVDAKEWKKGDRQGKNKKITADGCMRYCAANSMIVSEMDAHATCCEWTKATLTCNFRLGLATKWTGTTTSVFTAHGGDKDTFNLDVPAEATADAAPPADQQAQPDDQ